MLVLGNLGYKLGRRRLHAHLAFLAFILQVRKNAVEHIKRRFVLLELVANLPEGLTGVDHVFIVVSGDPNSELDVVASLKGRLISISCKAGKYDQQAIYEVKANADKFGGITSVPVLCADIDMERPEYVEKANELNVLLIEHKEMKKKKAAQMILKWMETH